MIKSFQFGREKQRRRKYFHGSLLVNDIIYRCRKPLLIPPVGKSQNFFVGRHDVDDQSIQQVPASELSRGVIPKSDSPQLFLQSREIVVATYFDNHVHVIGWACFLCLAIGIERNSSTADKNYLVFQGAECVVDRFDACDVDPVTQSMIVLSSLIATCISLTRPTLITSMRASAR